MDSSANDETANIVTQFQDYDEYLTSQITPIDLSYLEDEDIARQLVELGYRGTGDILKREDFENRKKAMLAKRVANRIRKRSLASSGKDIEDPFLKALADREDANTTGKLNTIIFIRDKNSKDQEISGYIDFADRLKKEDWNAYFSGRKRLLPKITDLSFYNWDTHAVFINPSDNYEVVTGNVKELFFRNKIDRKIVDVDPKSPTPGDSSTRTSLRCPKYIQVVFYDHITRRRH